MQPGYPYASEPDPRRWEVVLGPDDVIAITVWDQDDLTTEATIRPDGTFTMPRVGVLAAAGATPTELKYQIVDALRGGSGTRGVNENEVAVILRAWKSYHFALEGQVHKPGVYTADHYVTVREALAIGGGLTELARGSSIVLHRTAGGKPRDIPIDLDVLDERRDMNLYLLPGDVIRAP